jgi:hypothetical protein
MRTEVNLRYRYDWAALWRRMLTEQPAQASMHALGGRDQGVSLPKNSSPLDPIFAQHLGRSLKKCNDWRVGRPSPLGSSVGMPAARQGG